MVTPTLNQSSSKDSAPQNTVASSSSSQPAMHDMRVSELVQRSLTATDFFHPAVLMIQSDGRKFNAVRTFPNEASILHAIFGNSKQEVYYSANIRQLYISKIKEKLHEPNVQAAIDKVLNAYLEFYNDEEPNHEFAQVNARNARFLFQSSKIDKTENVSLRSRKEAQAKLYFKACIKRGYCFTRIDLELIAQVFKIKILVYSHVNNLEYSVGHGYVEQLVVIEGAHGLHSGNFYPCYQRCELRNAAKNAWDYVWNDNYAVLESQKVEVISTISQYFVNGIEKIILGYADIHIEESINNCMQAVLESEGWDKTIKSTQNWNFVRKFRKNVTHIRYSSCSDDDQLKRMHAIVCYQAFPLLNSIEFGVLPSAEEYRKVIAENPFIRTLAFQRISLEDLTSIARSETDFMRRIENFAVKISSSKIKQNPTQKPSSFLDTLEIVIKSFSNLLRISVASDLSPSDDLFQSITKQFPTIRYLDFNGGKVSIEKIKEYIGASKEKLCSLDLQLAHGYQTKFPDVNIDERNLTIRSAIINSDGTLIPFLATLPMLSELNISSIQFNIEECSHLKYCKGLRVLKMPRCCDNVIDVISKLTLLEELDITGCKMDVSKVSLLSRLKRLRILHWGDFCTHTYGSGPDYYSSPDDSRTLEFEYAFKAALPNLEKLNTKELYSITRFKRDEKPLKP